MSDLQPHLDAAGGFLLYRTEDGRSRLEVRLEAETVWLSLTQLAELFQRDKSVISRHLKNLFDEGELMRERVVAKFATTASDGKTYQVEFFNLDAIISVGYRVNSYRGTQFRVWATERNCYSFTNFARLTPSLTKYTPDGSEETSSLLPVWEIS